MGEEKPVRVLNAPALPQPPSFKGSTKAERRAFMREYQRYTSQIDALQSSGQRPFLMPVGACMDHFSKRRIAMFDLGKSHGDVTEAEWVAWFMEAHEEEPVELDALKKRLQVAVQFDTKILDADSRVSRMLDNLMRALEADGQEWVLHQEGKLVVSVITKAIKPAALQLAVAKQLQLQRNKMLKTDVFRYVRWLRQFAVGYQLYGGMEEPKPSVEEPKKDLPGPRRGRGNDKPKVPAIEPVVPRGGKDLPPERPKPKCLKCQSTEHRVRDHPGITDVEVKQLMDAFHQSRRKVVNALASEEKANSMECRATVEDVLSLPRVLLDSGSDETLVSEGLLLALERHGAKPSVEIKPQLLLQPYGSSTKPLTVTRQVQFKTMTLETSIGPLVLRGLRAWVEDGRRDIDVLIGRPAMERLGFSVDGMLVDALKQRQVWDLADVGEAEKVSAHISRLQASLQDDPEDAIHADDVACMTPSMEKLADPDGEVRRILDGKIDEAVKLGLSAEQEAELRRILERHVDVFRLEFGQDLPVDVEPLKVRLKEGAVPVKTALRRYPPAHMDYLKKHVEELEAAGLVYRNNRATWAAAPRIVAKKAPGEYRMTIDSRPINAWTVPMPWPMPNLDAAMATLVGKTAFFTLDWLKGYWQLPLHPSCQMWYSFMTPFGVYTPTRILMGQTDAVAFCQSVVNQMFGELLYEGVLGWLDDLLGYANSVDKLFVLLDKVLAICGRFRLKLHPKKCDFFLKKATWCGKVISAEGVSHSPDRVQGLCALETPATGADLQQFVCATNWMRSSIPSYAKLVEPLRGLLDVAAKTAGGSKKTALSRVKLAAVGWAAEHDECFAAVKKTLQQMVPLSHPSAEKIICLYTDASETHWGAACTQIPPEDLDKPVDQQRHEPLAFLSGSFGGASARWPTVEKEAFAIVESCKRLEYLLLRQQGFRLFTDHRNLLYIFNPLGYNSNMARYQAHKLQRWAMVLTTFPYTLEHVAGEDNVWADLLSRWGAAPQSTPVARVRQLVVVSPLQDKDFAWPTAAKIVEAQRASMDAASDDAPSVTWSEQEGYFMTAAGKVWIPDAAVELQHRICIIAHQGAAGHRGVDVTTQGILERFEWSTAKEDVKAFVSKCLHCLCVDSTMVPRPWGAALHAERPNELIHFDWLQLPPAANGWKYVLVVKDDMSGFCRLFPSACADAERTAEALMDWFATHGIVRTWVSDGGSHFKNEVVDKIKRMIGAHHHITTPYTPWANGTVEVVNRLVLRGLKTLTSEMKLRPDEWYRVLPLVQSALNHQPSERLGGVAPVTAFQGLPSTPPLSGFVHPRTKEVMTVDWLSTARQKHMDALQQAMENVHRDVSQRSEKLRSQARGRRGQKSHVRPAKFALGDFVLVGKVIKFPSKLALNWKGPYRVSRVDSDYVMEVQQLVEPFATSVHHASRLKFFSDASLDVTEDLKDYAAFGDEGFYVEDLLGARYSAEGKYEVRVKWKGLEIEEASWEPASQLYEDIPVVLRRWIAKNASDSVVKALQDDLETTLDRPL